MVEQLKRFEGSGFAAAGVFLVLRFLVIVLLPYRFFIMYGDLINFFRVAEIPGWPFLDYWVEFPPVFPFISEIIFRLSNGIEVVYVYILAGFFTFYDAGNVVLFSLLARKIDFISLASKKIIFYTIILALFPYGWWYFEPLVVFFVLLSLLFVVQKKKKVLGIAVAIGVLIKLFPILVIIPAWFNAKKRDSSIVIIVIILLLSGVYATLWYFSPEFTLSSIMSQYSKGSWETVWALLDGNKGTGNFGPLSERLDPSLAYFARGFPSKIPPLLIVALFGGIGMMLLGKYKNFSTRGVLSLFGLSWALLMIATPGWSPQWVMVILPICLLIFSPARGMLISATLLLINFTEWPLIISRGRLDLLWVPIFLRLFIHILLSLFFARICLTKNDVLKNESEINIKRSEYFY